MKKEYLKQNSILEGFKSRLILFCILVISSCTYKYGVNSRKITPQIQSELFLSSVIEPVIYKELKDSFVLSTKVIVFSEYWGEHLYKRKRIFESDRYSMCSQLDSSQNNENTVLTLQLSDRKYRGYRSYAKHYQKFLQNSYKNGEMIIIKGGVILVDGKKKMYFRDETISLYKFDPTIYHDYIKARQVFCVDSLKYKEGR